MTQSGNVPSCRTLRRLRAVYARSDARRRECFKRGEQPPRPKFPFPIYESGSAPVPTLYGCMSRPNRRMNGAKKYPTKYWWYARRQAERFGSRAEIGG